HQAGIRVYRRALPPLARGKNSGWTMPKVSNFFMNKLKKLGFVLLLLWATRGHSQDVESANNRWFVRAGFAPAFILPTNPFLSTGPDGGDPIGWAPSVTVEIGRRTDG